MECVRLSVSLIGGHYHNLFNNYLQESLFECRKFMVLFTDVLKIDKKKLIRKNRQRGDSYIMQVNLKSWEIVKIIGGLNSLRAWLLNAPFCYFLSTVTTPQVSKLALTGDSLTEMKHPTLTSGIRFRNNSVGCLWIEHVFPSAYINSNC